MRPSKNNHYDDLLTRMKVLAFVHTSFMFFSFEEVKGEKENQCQASCPRCWEQMELRTSWGDPEQFCNNQDGHLALVTNERIQNYLQSKEPSKDSHSSFWVAGTDKEHEGNWVWTDGSACNYTEWATRPYRAQNEWYNEDCLLMYKSCVKNPNGWNDQECSNQWSFVCSRFWYKQQEYKQP